MFDRTAAPRKELLVVESDTHLLFTEDLDVVLPPLLDRLRAVASTCRAGDQRLAEAQGLTAVTARL